MNIAFTLIVFHMIDRQTEYVARVDYKYVHKKLFVKHDAKQIIYP
jgi:hypothetical protein